MKLAGMTASVAGNYAKTKLKTLFLDEASSSEALERLHDLNGGRIAETLGELKGAVMKVGQMASIAKDVLPKELADALDSLHHEAPPMAYSVIAEQITKELGAPPEQLFNWFAKEPFAAASIGQVHRAATDDGREVVVKVQYPGVDGAVDSDIKHLKLAFLASGLVKMDRKALDAVLGEIRARLNEELDYCNEADNVRFFREAFGDDPRIIVPEVVGERSSQRVLTLTYEPGDSLSKLKDLGYSQSERDELGHALVTLMLDQIFRLQTIHADPNPGNFAFRRDGRIVMYDYGCVKKLNTNMLDAYRFTIREAIDENYEAVEQGLRRLDVRNLKGPTFSPDYYKLWRDIFARPFLSETPFDFGRSTIHRDVLQHMPVFMTKYATAFQPSAEMVFLDRVIAGHYGNLCHLGCRGTFGSQLNAYVRP